MKKNFLLIIILTLCLFGCGVSHKVKDEEYSYIIKTNGFTGVIPEGRVIESVEEFIKYISEESYYDYRNSSKLKKYDEEFFKTKSLVIQPWRTVSNSDYFIIESYKITGNKIYLNIKQTVWGVTMGFGENYMILEIDSEKVKNIDTVTCKWINKE